MLTVQWCCAAHCCAMQCCAVQCCAMLCCAVECIVATVCNNPMKQNALTKPNFCSNPCLRPARHLEVSITVCMHSEPENHGHLYIMPVYVQTSTLGQMIAHNCNAKVLEGLQHEMLQHAVYVSCNPKFSTDLKTGLCYCRPQILKST